MRRLSIHLGLHKTGTSYLQAYLVRNRAALATAGLAVPPATHKDSHEQYALALRDGGAQALLQAVDWRLGDHQVISSERIGSLLCTPRLGLARALAELAERQHIELNIILLLRRQDILKESIFSEVVKTWYRGSIADERHYDYDFDARLKYLEEALGIDRLRVAIYRRRGPTPLADMFLGLLGLDPGALSLSGVRQRNVRMNRRETLFLSQVPKEVPRFAEAVRFAVERNDFIRDDGHENLMSPAQHEEFLSRYVHGNEALMSRYGLSDPSWTSPDFGDRAAWAPPADIEPQEYIAVMMEAAALSWAEATRRVKAARQ